VTATAASAPTPGARAPDPQAATRPPLRLLARVELRKMVDTRAGRWLVAVCALLVAAVAAVYVLAADAPDVTFENVFAVVQFPVGVLLPAVAILLVTSEWSQRTALTTFTLVPARERVIAAKAIAVGIVAVLATLAALGAAALAHALGDGRSWAFDAATLAEAFVFQLLGLAMGFAFGLLLQASAPAIVAYYVVPAIVGIVLGTVPALDGVGDWADTGTTLEPLVDPEAAMDGTAWARLAVAHGLWVAVPLLLGLVRLRRTELM
jgi:hypothetical protein